MHAQSFEIKVALLGHVSVGKTTVLNALFQDKFSEVSMRRTTAGINFFRVSSCGSKTADLGSKNDKDSSGVSDKECAGEKTSNHPGNVDRSAANDVDPDTACDKAQQQNDNNSISSDDTDSNIIQASQTLAEITADNRMLRKKNTIHERIFDIQLDSPIFEMRQDTRLVIIDIPGVNEAGSSSIYLHYVEKSWDTFDCVIVVMDAVQGVNAEEHIKLLQFVKSNLDKNKCVPIIVLCNKVDDPDDSAMKMMVDEVCAEVEKTFGAPNQKESLSCVLQAAKKKLNRTANEPLQSPAFIPISAGNAFLYRAASRLRLEEFKMLDRAILDKIGQEEIGRFRWKRLTVDQQYEEIYKVIKDPSQYQERLAATNFDRFLSTLEYFVGGASVQENLIESQLEVALKKLSPQGNFTDQLEEIHKRSTAIRKPLSNLKRKFWECYFQCHETSFNRFYEDPMEITSMHHPMKELRKYAQGLHQKLHTWGGISPYSTEKKNDEARIIETMKNVVKQVCRVLLEKEAVWELPVMDIVDEWEWVPYDWCWVNRETGERRSGFQSKHPDKDKNLPSHWIFDDRTGTWNNKYTKRIKTGTKENNPGFQSLVGWAGLSPRDWNNAVNSILLMTHNKYFCEHFGKEITDLEWLKSTGKFILRDWCTGHEQAENTSSAFSSHSNRRRGQ